MQSKKQNNDFYQKLGVEAPSHEAHGTQEELERKFAENRTHGHIWQQRGSFVVCTSCPFEHSFSVPTSKILKGTDEKGMPILESIQIFDK